MEVCKECLSRHPTPEIFLLRGNVQLYNVYSLGGNCLPLGQAFSLLLVQFPLYIHPIEGGAFGGVKN